MAAGALRALGLAGGIAYATIPDSSGAIHACYGPLVGDLRVVDAAASCRRFETAIDLGGPTRGYAYSSAGDMTLGTAASTELARVALPGGKYLVHAKANLIDLSFGSPDGALAVCDLRIDGTTTMLDQDRVLLEGPVTTSEAYVSDVALQSPLVLAGPGNALLECAAQPRGATATVSARFRQLDAVSVDGLVTTGS